MTEPFVHLHVHSHYSLLDGAAKVHDLVQRAAEYKMPAMALTDHGNLFGALEFYQEAKKAGIKPIIGYEAYITPGSCKDKEKLAEKEKLNHITLLAKNFEGYKNLMKLASEAYLTGFYYKPRIDKELLSSHATGIIALSGCLSGEICTELVADHKKKALDIAAFYRDLFKDDFYIEIQENKIADQTKANHGLVEIAKELNLKMVFTNDIHYLRLDDAKPHEILLCIQTGKTMKDENRFRFSSNEFYMKSSEQMYEESKDYPDAAKNTVEVAQKTDLTINMGKNHLPAFVAPNNMDNEKYLRELCEKGLADRYGTISQELRDRFEYEFKVISKMGFVPYFLIVWDFINYSRSQKISVGPGRGSAAGSVVSYALKITNLDPFKYNLIFERFLNEGRNDMPDIDIDFETNRRGEVVEYVTQKYGRKQVCQIITFGTMAARGAIRDVGRVLDIPLADVDRIAKKVPTGLKMTLEKGLETDPDFKQLYDTDAQARELIDIAKRLEGLNRQPGMHAAGVIIADRDISEYCPLYKNPDGNITTQYSMDHMVNLGLLKMDFLGLSTLTLIEKVLEIIEKSRGVKVDLDHLPIDDKPTYEMLAHGETNGVFQLESEGMQELVKKLRPDCFEDIIALVALYRPGPLGSGMVDTYCRCKHGEEKPAYKHPVLEPILKETHGMILYQEQAMQIAKDFSGFTLTEADKLRKAMGKKKKDIMDAYRQKFIDGSHKLHGAAPEVANEIFDLIDYFSGYGFNKSHSAAYALVAYQTAYLKARYKIEFMAGLMTMESQDTDKIVKYTHECESMGIGILPPDVNYSDSSFSVTPQGIRFGLCAIKGVGEKAIEALVSSRKKTGKFHSIFHLCENVDTRLMNKQVLESLAKSGAMDSFGKSRGKMCAVIPVALQKGGNVQKQKQSNQKFFNFGDEENEESKPESASAASSSSDSAYPAEEPWSENEKLKFEKETLGFYLTSHPLKQWGQYLERLATHKIGDLRPDINVSVLIGCIVVAAKEITVKQGKNQGKKMANFTLEDDSGTIRAVCFPDAYEGNRQFLKEDQILFVRGRMDSKKTDPEIFIEEAIPVEKGIEQLVRMIMFSITSKNEENVYELRKICGNHKGKCRTVLQVEANEYRTAIEVNEKYYLQPSYALFQEVEKVLGRDAFSISR